jgi:hypothetical protein
LCRPHDVVEATVRQRDRLSGDVRRQGDARPFADVRSRDLEHVHEVGIEVLLYLQRVGRLGEALDRHALIEPVAVDGEQPPKTDAPTAHTITGQNERLVTDGVGIREIDGRLETIVRDRRVQ